MARQVGSLFVTLSLRNDLNQGLTAARSELSNLGTSFQRAGARVSGFGRSMMVATLPLAGALGGAVFAAGRFDTAMANTGSLLGQTREEMAGVSAEILAMGSNSLAGPQATAEAFYDIVSGVADATTHMAVLEAAMNTSEAGAADLGATTGVLVGIMNAYELSASGANTTSDILTSTVQNGVLTMDELASALPTVTALAAASGVGFSELAGSVALITQGGSSASQATTQLRGAMLSLLNPNARMTEALNELGYESGQTMLNALGLQGSLAAIAGTAAVATNGLAGTLGSSEALGAALVLAGDSSGDFLANFSGDMTDAQQSMFDMIREAEGMEAALDFEASLNLGFTGATAEAQAIQLESFGAKMALVKAKIQGLAIVIGNALLPAVIDVVDAVTPLVQAFADWAVENPALLTDLVKLVGLLIVLGPVLMVVGRAMSLFGATLGLVSKAFLLLNTPWIAAVAAGVALGLAVFWLGTHLDVVQEKMQVFWEKLGPIGQAMTVIAGVLVAAGIAASLLGSAAAIAAPLVGLMIAAFGPILGPIVLVGALVAAIYAVGKALGVDWGAVLDTMSEAFTGAFDVMKTTVNGLINILGVIPGLIAGIALGIAGLVGITDKAVTAESVMAEVAASGGSAAVAQNVGIAQQTMETWLNNQTTAPANIGQISQVFASGDPFPVTPTPAPVVPIPGNARGGPVQAGVPTFVGERGMELFVPSSNGRIIPNNALGGGGGAMHVNVLNVYANDPEDLYDKLMKIQKRRAQ